MTSFLQEFAETNKFGWVTVRLGYYGSNREGNMYIKWFLDTIVSDKPLGHLAQGFKGAGVTDLMLTSSLL